ncbi:MAG: type II toxin-antitoxin system VapC family toxin [Armatimonadota bacterium]|nr:type II toxin-antitoxin system VapC family toxin [Armatimonadota bacterium]
MKRLLLDTHTFLWFILNNPQLSAHSKELIENAETLFLSIASIWEMAIKVSAGKLPLPKPWDQFILQQILRNKITLLPIEYSHTVTVSSLPFHHRDPFDRMIIAQSLVEQVPIVSVDGVFDDYGVQRLWQPQ